eukprot:6460584-Amphidinium_carterae.1
MGVNTGSHTFLTSSSNSARTSENTCLLSSLVIDSANLSVTGRGVVPLTILVPTRMSHVRSVMGRTTNNLPSSPRGAKAFCFSLSSNLLTETYSPKAGLVHAFDSARHCRTCVAYSKACAHHGTWNEAACNKRRMTCLTILTLTSAAPDDCGEYPE